MATLNDNYEIVDQIKFFGALVSTPGVSEEVKETCNKYLDKLTKALDKTVEESINSMSVIKVVKGGM